MIIHQKEMDELDQKIWREELKKNREKLWKTLKMIRPRKRRWRFYTHPLLKKTQSLQKKQNQTLIAYTESVLEETTSSKKISISASDQICDIDMKIFARKLKEKINNHNKEVYNSWIWKFIERDGEIL